MPPATEPQVISDFTLWGCTYPRHWDTITYHYEYVGSTYQNATYEGREAWNSATGIPDFRGSGEAAPLTIKDGYWEFNNAWAWVTRPAGCLEYHIPNHVTQKTFMWNTATSRKVTNAFKAKIAMHELGHAYGLAHDNPPCNGSTIMGPNVTNCAQSITSEDVNRVRRIYTS